MFDAEKLLGKVLSGAMQGHVKKGKKKKNRSGDNLIGSLVGSLASGKGLITAIGLGVGAYEILRQSSAKGATGVIGGTGPQPMPAPPPAPAAAPVSPAMPPPLPSHGAPAGPAITPPAPGGEATAEQQLAVRLIRVMVAAAHADGQLDEEEERRILERLQEQGLSREERQFLLQELHAPKGIEELTAGVDSPMIAQTLYSLAVATIIIDTDEERRWLDALAASLGVSPAMQRFIEQDAG